MSLFPKKKWRYPFNTCRVEIHLCQCWHSLMAVLWGGKACWFKCV